MSNSNQYQERVGWSVTEWAKATGLSRATVFNLLRDERLESVKFGTKRIITTAPAAFLESLKGAA